ncbi:S41 family peptidase [bacterium]|nr:S41 family peptidase [bacterium]
MRNKAIPLLVLIVIGLVTVWGITQEDDENNIYKMIKLIDNVTVETYRNYVDPIDTPKLIKAGIKGMLQTLDPHTQFFEKKQYDDLKVGTQGKFEGIGVVIGLRDEVLTVISPIEGTPGYRVGLQAGDQIVKIEGRSTKGISMEDAIEKLRGPKGSVVHISVRRKAEPNLLEYDITRDVIEIKSVPYYGVLDNNIGYIRLSRFSEESGYELREAITFLQEKEIDGLVLDLRSNPGGLLSQAIEVAGLFLNAGDLIVYTKGKSAFQNKDFQNRSDGIYKEKPLVVLVNRGSASASEIVSGAIQDHDRGLVLGSRTFGKGLVQSIIPLDDGQALKITTAKYYIPSGRCIQRDDYLQRASTSIISDYTLEEEDSLLDYEEDFENDFEDLTGLDPEEDTFDSTELPTFFTDNGRIVYGGGGIFPDIRYTPEILTRLEVELERKTMFFGFAVNYTTDHKELEPGFEVDDEIMTEFMDYLEENEFSYKSRAEEELDKIIQLAEENGYDETTMELIESLQASLEREKDKDFERSMEYIINGIKREIIAKLWGTEKRYELVTTKTDPELNEAIRVLTDSEEYNNYLNP